MSGFHRAIIGVADLTVVRSLWQETFGFEPVTLSKSQQDILIHRWGLSPDEAPPMLQLRTPGQASNESLGQLLFVEFGPSVSSVRAGAGATDLCPKNLDVYVKDLPGKVAGLKAAGCHFRNDAPSEVTAPNGVRFRELHLHGHDDINIVLLEILDKPLPFTPQGFAGIGALVTIVNELEAEVEFHRERGGLHVAAEHCLDGPEIERMIGLPPGSALEITILGDESPFGQLEIINYRGATGNNRYPGTLPPARGILEIEMGADPASLELIHSPAGLRTWR